MRATTYWLLVAGFFLLIFSSCQSRYWFREKIRVSKATAPPTQMARPQASAASMPASPADAIQVSPALAQKENSKTVLLPKAKAAQLSASNYINYKPIHNQNLPTRQGLTPHAALNTKTMVLVLLAILWVSLLLMGAPGILTFACFVLFGIYFTLVNKQSKPKYIINESKPKESKSRSRRYLWIIGFMISIGICFALTILFADIAITTLFLMVLMAIILCVISISALVKEQDSEIKWLYTLGMFLGIIMTTLGLYMALEVITYLF